MDYYDASLSRYGVRCGTSLRFRKNKGWIKFRDPYDWFQIGFRYRLGRRSYDNERQIARCKGIVRRFKSELVNTIKDVNVRFDDYAISPIIRYIFAAFGL